MKKIGAFLLAVITICLFTGCTFQIGNSALLETYYATPDEAYAKDATTPATLDSKAIAPVDDTHAIWIAQDKENTIYILEMLTKDGKYHFAGNEMQFGLEDIPADKNTGEIYYALADSDANLHFCFSRHDNADGYQVVPFAEDDGLTVYFKYKLLITSQATTDINYNNYILDNYVDYSENRFAWLKNDIFGTKLTILDDKSNYAYFVGINAPFQINDTQIVFVDNNKLKIRDINTKKTAEAADDVDRFVLYKGDIIYTSVGVFDDKAGKWTNKLYRYDLQSKNSKILYENVKQFYIHNEKLFAVNDDEWLVEISFSDATSKNIVHFQPEQYPAYVMPQGDNLLYLYSNQLNFFDLNTGSTKTVSIVDSQYVNNRINYICDDHNVFLSFQATKTNGSVVTDISDDNNGLWAVNTKTLKKEKICSDVFEQLYLFDDALLLGTKNNSFYKIDTVTKQVTQILS